VLRRLCLILCYCSILRWAGWEGNINGWLTTSSTLPECFDTVCWVPVKISSSVIVTWDVTQWFYQSMHCWVCGWASHWNRHTIDLPKDKTFIQSHINCTVTEGPLSMYYCEPNLLPACEQSCMNIYCASDKQQYCCQKTPQIWNQTPLAIRTYHHSTVSNTTLKPIISPFHEIPTHLATACTSDLSLFLMLVHWQIYYGTLHYMLHFDDCRCWTTGETSSPL